VTPTLFGRIQTRLFVLAVIGSLVALVITPVLPMDAPLGDKYAAMFGVLLIVGVVGIGWELLYHFLQQFRWEKDWPTLFGLLTGVPEGIVAFLIARSGVLGATSDIGLVPFVIGFTAVWLAVFLFVNGPMRVVALHWRYRGGRLV
jgi:hypothetical protein